MQRVSLESFLARLLDWGRHRDASDLHGQADRPFFIRCHGRLREVPFAPNSPFQATMTWYLFELLAAGVVARETAELYGTNRHKLELALRGISRNRPILKPDSDR